MNLFCIYLTHFHPTVTASMMFFNQKGLEFVPYTYRCLIAGANCYSQAQILKRGGTGDSGIKNASRIRTYGGLLWPAIATGRSNTTARCICSNKPPPKA